MASDVVSSPADDVRTVYLVPPPGPDLTKANLIDEFWQDGFEEKLAAWTLDQTAWPSPRTRELFDTWFDLGSPRASSILFRMSL
jgi:hypothetical protein